MSPTFVRRALVTLGGLGLYRLAIHVPLPGVDTRVLGEFGPGVWTASWFQRDSVLPFGLEPYLAAAGLVLLFSAVVAPLRRLRDGSRLQHARFDRLVYGVAALLAAAQSWSLTSFLGGVSGPSSGAAVVAHPGWAFRLTTMATVAAATLAAVWVAEQITRRGVGNGLALIVAADILVPVAPEVRRQYLQWRASAGPADPLATALSVVVPLALLALGVAFVQAHRRLPLRRGTEATPVAALLRPNAAGAWPIYAAASLAYLPAFLGLTGGPGPVHRVFAVALVPALAGAYAAITFSPAGLVERAGRLGYHVAEAGEDAVRYVRRAMTRVAVTGCLGLSLVAAAPLALDRWLGLPRTLAGLFGTSLLVVAAVAVDTWRQACQHWREAGAAGQGAGVAWVPATTTETVLEGELVADLLGRAGIAATVRHSRPSPLLGTLSFWESAPPAWPCLTLHRRLGGGEVAVWVPEERSGDAAGALTKMGIEAR